MPPQTSRFPGGIGGEGYHSITRSLTYLYAILVWLRKTTPPVVRVSRLWVCVYACGYRCVSIHLCVPSCLYGCVCPRCVSYHCACLRTFLSPFASHSLFFACFFSCLVFSFLSNFSLVLVLFCLVFVSFFLFVLPFPSFSCLRLLSCPLPPVPVFLHVSSASV